MITPQHLCHLAESLLQVGAIRFFHLGLKLGPFLIINSGALWGVLKCSEPAFIGAPWPSRLLHLHSLHREANLPPAVQANRASPTV